MEEYGTSYWVQTLYIYPRLPQLTLNEFRTPIEDDEVKATMFGMDARKAPIPNGFPASFY